MLVETSKTIIRDIEFKDISSVIDLIHQFYDESLIHYKVTVSKSSLISTITGYIKNQNQIGLVAEKEDKLIGVIGGVVSPSSFDEFQLIGQESIWYINKDHRRGSTGLGLLKGFEDRCRNLGAEIIFMIHMHNLNAETLKSFYRKSGYIPMETHYMKEL